MNPLHMNVSPSMHSSFFELSATFGSYEPEMLPPTITKFSGFRFSSRAPNKADITFFPPGTTPADVKTILNCTFPSTLIGDAEDIALSFYPGQLLELRMVVSNTYFWTVERTLIHRLGSQYPQYPNAELSIRVRVRGTFLMKGMLLKAAAKAVKCFYRTVQVSNGDDVSINPNYLPLFMAAGDNHEGRSQGLQQPPRPRTGQPQNRWIAASFSEGRYLEYCDLHEALIPFPVPHTHNARPIDTWHPGYNVYNVFCNLTD